MRVMLLRPAAVERDPALLPARWQLSDEGRAAARALAREPIWRDIDRIYTSPAVKAQETAQIIAGPNGITVTVVEDLRAVERSAGRWVGDDSTGGYSVAVAAYFASPEEPVHGWEPAARAQARIRACIDRLLAGHGERGAVAGHGLTLSLYVASVTGLDAATIWRTLTLPDLAMLDTTRRELVWPFGRWRPAALPR